MRWIDGLAVEQCCPLCGALGAKPVRLEVQSPFRGAGPLKLLECGACTSQFFDDQSLPPDYYEDHTAAVKFYVQQGAGIDHMIFPLLRVPAERVKSMAEIGCGFGFALDFARTALGWRVRGIDRSKAAQAGADVLGLDIVPAYFEGPWSLGGETFDLVFCSEVIEHVPDPNGFVRGIAGILEPDGVAIFTTPDAAAIRPEQSVGSLLRVLSPGFHLVLFTAGSLHAVLEQAGFSHIRIETDGEGLKAYASRAPLELVPVPSRAQRLYRRYLTVRGRAKNLDMDLRVGLKYRHFKTLVNAAVWREAEAEFADLRAIVREGYGFDLEAPDTVPTLDPMPSDESHDLHHARLFLQAFLHRVPANIVSLLYFRGSLSLCTGRSAEALGFFRAAGKIGVVALSLRHSLANDGETADLFKRSFMLRVLALADVAPATALVELARILHSEPPEGVPEAFWAFTRADQEWLLGTLFTRLVDLGHRAPAQLVYDRLRERLVGAYAFDPSRPAAASPPAESPGAVPRDEGVQTCQPGAHLSSLPSGMAAICFARGLLELVAGRGSEALPCFGNAADILLATVPVDDEPPEPVRERAALFTRIRTHVVLALSEVDGDDALVHLRRLLDGTRPPDVPSALWNVAAFDRRELTCRVFVALVNRGAYLQAASLVSEIEPGLGAGTGGAPDSVALGADRDCALDAAFCRAMLALNHEQDYGRAAAWFRSVHDAACERWRRGTASASAVGLLWTARYHEALALVRGADTQAAASVVEAMAEPHLAHLPPVPEALVSAGRGLVAPDPPPDTGPAAD